jgi:hypothetical protein
MPPTATGLGLAELAQEGDEEQQPPSASLDPVAFSFRLAANLPLGDELRQQLLAAESLIDRCGFGVFSSID